MWVLLLLLGIAIGFNVFLLLALLGHELRKELKQELLADDAKEYRKKVRKECEEQWNNEKKAVLRKEVEKYYELMLQRMRGDLF